MSARFEQENHGEVTGYKLGYTPWGKPSLFVYCYYVDGLLIDTGQSKMKKEVLDFTKELPLSQITITHHHEDHTGNLIPIQAHHQCPAYASPRTCEIMKSPPPISIAQQLYWGNRPGTTVLQPLKGRIETDQFQFDIIPIPGHAEDMVALHEPSQGWLFSADLYVNSYIAYFLRNESTQQQIESLKRILKLDFDTLFCCHNPQLTGGKEKLEKKLHFLQGFYEQVADLHRQAYAPNQIMKKMKLSEKWGIRLASHGHLSRLNMINSVIRDESKQRQNP